MPRSVTTILTLLCAAVALAQEPDPCMTWYDGKAFKWTETCQCMLFDRAVVNMADTAVVAFEKEWRMVRTRILEKTTGNRKCDQRYKAKFGHMPRVLDFKECTPSEQNAIMLQGGCPPWPQ